MKYRTIVADPPWELSASPSAWQSQGGVDILPYGTMSGDAISSLPVASHVEAGGDLYLWTITQHLATAERVIASWGFVRSALLVWCKEPRGVRMGGTFASNVEFVLYCRDRNGLLRLTRHLASAARASGVTAKDVDREFGTNGMGGWWLQEKTQLHTRCPNAEQWKRLKEMTGATDDLDEVHEELIRSLGPREAVNTRWFTWPRGKHSAKPDAFYDLVEQVSPGPYLELFARRQRLGWDTWGNEALEHVTLEV